MNIDELTLGQVKEIQKSFITESASNVDTSYKIGDKRLFRTVTMIYTGEIVAMYKDEFVLKNAAWIADTGRWNEALVSCNFVEVEPYPEDKEVIVHRGAMLDSVKIDTLPREVK